MRVIPSPQAVHEQHHIYCVYEDQPGYGEWELGKERQIGNQFRDSAERLRTKGYFFFFLIREELMGFLKVLELLSFSIYLGGSVS